MTYHSRLFVPMVLAFGVTLLSFTAVAQADTQTKFVGTAVTVSNGDFDWDNPDRVTANDGSVSQLSDAMTTTTESSWFLDCTMSGNVFTIPAGATINGITVTMESEDLEKGPCHCESYLWIRHSIRRASGSLVEGTGC